MRRLLVSTSQSCAAHPPGAGLGPDLLGLRPDAHHGAAGHDPPAPPAVAPAPTGPALRRLPAVAGPLRLWGETGTVTWPLFVTAAEARAGGRFQVGYLSAISVLPEASTLRIVLNGAEIGRTAIDGARGLRRETVTIPPGALRPGFNAVTIAVDQRHRVDCSVPATYELWTQIDPDTTGLAAVGGGHRRPRRSRRHPAGPRRRRADPPDPDRRAPVGAPRRRPLAGAQALALAGRFAQPAVSFAPAPESGDGIALAVAPAAELARSLDIASLGPVTGPRLALLPGRPDRRPVVVVTGPGEADVSAALAQLANWPPSRRRARHRASKPCATRTAGRSPGREPDARRSRLQ